MSKKDLSIEQRIRIHFSANKKDEWLYKRGGITEGRLCKEATEEIERLRAVEFSYNNLRSQIKSITGYGQLTRAISALEDVPTYFKEIKPLEIRTHSPLLGSEEASIKGLSSLYNLVYKEVNAKASKAVKEYKERAENYRKDLLIILKQTDVFLSKKYKG